MGCEQRHQTDQTQAVAEHEPGVDGALQGGAAAVQLERARGCRLPATSPTQSGQPRTRARLATRAPPLHQQPSSYIARHSATRVACSHGFLFGFALCFNSILKCFRLFIFLQICSIILG